MKITLKERLGLFVDKYLTAPLWRLVTRTFDSFLSGMDRIMGNEVPPVSDEEQLREYRSGTELSSENVPAEFRDLLPLATKWGIGDDAIRGDVTEAATEAEKQHLVEALAGRMSALDQWVMSFSEDKMSDEAAAFMYMGEAVDEMDLDIDWGPSRQA